MTRDALAARIASFVDAPDPSAFDALALDIHAWQVAHDPVVRALCDGRPARTVDRIPAVPVGLFRDLDVGTVRPEEPHVAFHTSGTTVGRPGVHRMRDTALYDRGALAHARPWLPSSKLTFALMPDAPHSSLAHMVRSFAPITGPVRFLQRGDQLDREPLDRATSAVFVCATAFALNTWIDRNPLPLPEGSAIMLTGGFKGREHTLDQDALVREASARAPVVLEYGMTELSSQLWAHAGAPYSPPPWLRVTPVDPVTGEPVPVGEPGQLRFMDLCNLDGTLHVETLDEGVLLTDGGLVLRGRLPDAPLRGCSLSSEDLG